MSETREFATLDVVTCTTGVLVSDGGIGAVYEVLDFVLSDALMTHQLPNASRTATPFLYRQHPWLAALDPPKGDLPALKAWCARLVDERGATVTVEAAADGDVAWRTGNALQDLVDIANGRRIVAVLVQDDGADR